MLFKFSLRRGSHLAWSVDPSQVGEVRVHRHTHNLAVDVVELVGLVAEWDNFCWAHEGAAGLQAKNKNKERLSDIAIKPELMLTSRCEIFRIPYKPIKISLL